MQTPSDENSLEENRNRAKYQMGLFKSMKLYASLLSLHPCGAWEAGLFPKEIPVLRFLMKFRFSAPQEPGTGNQEYGNQEPGLGTGEPGTRAKGNRKPGFHQKISPLDPRAVISLCAREPQFP